MNNSQQMYQAKNVTRQTSSTSTQDQPVTLSLEAKTSTKLKSIENQKSQNKM